MVFIIAKGRAEFPEDDLVPGLDGRGKNPSRYAHNHSNGAVSPGYLLVDGGVGNRRLSAQPSHALREGALLYPDAGQPLHNAMKKDALSVFIKLFSDGHNLFFREITDCGQYGFVFIGDELSVFFPPFLHPVLLD